MPELPKRQFFSKYSSFTLTRFLYCPGMLTDASSINVFILTA
jgi:hypothetical protein